MKSARANEKSAVKNPTTATLLRILWIKYNMIIDAIGSVEAMVVAMILEIRSSLAWGKLPYLGYFLSNLSAVSY